MCLCIPVSRCSLLGWPVTAVDNINNFIKSTIMCILNGREREKERDSWESSMFLFYFPFAANKTCRYNSRKKLLPFNSNWFKSEKNGNNLCCIWQEPIAMKYKYVFASDSWLFFDISFLLPRSYCWVWKMCCHNLKCLSRPKIWWNIVSGLFKGPKLQHSLWFMNMISIILSISIFELNNFELMPICDGSILWVRVNKIS